MLTKKTPETFKAIAKITSLGEGNTLVLTYYNRAPDQLVEAMKEHADIDKLPENVDPIAWVNSQALLFMVKSFDDGTDAEFPLTLEGLLDLDAHYPGAVSGLVQLYHQSRQATVEKN